MTNERPIGDARCWLFNTADRNVDVYLNYHESSLYSVKPEEDQPVFSIDSDADGTYGTYTFEAREAGDPDDEPLASVSVDFAEGDSYAAVFHQVGDAEYAFAVYENDYSPSGDTRLEIRHTGRAEEIDWTLEPKAEADPRIPVDERSGTLERGEWQQALDVTENEYRLEVLVDDEVVAFRRDLELEANRMIVVYLRGDPQPWMGADEKEDHILRQEYQIQTGERREDEITEPEEPSTTSDDNEPIQFDFEPLECYHTNRVETTIGATDPDGIVSALGIESVTPDTDGFVIPDGSVDPTMAIGGQTTATVLAKPDIAPGSYEVTIVSNPDSLGERVTCTVPVQVKRITVDRLRELVRGYREDSELTDAVANELRSLLNAVEGVLEPDAPAELDVLRRELIEVIEAFLGHRLHQSVETALDELLEAAGVVPSEDPTDACSALDRIVTVVGEHEKEGVSAEAAADLETETLALREYLGCD